MRIIFLGSVYFSNVMLEKLIEMNARIMVVITKEFSSFNLDFEGLYIISQSINITFKYLQNINDISSID